MVINYTNDSTAVEFWEYNSDNRVLRIKYRSGRIYDYLEVSESTVGKVAGSASFGSAIAKYVRGTHYFTEVKET